MNNIIMIILFHIIGDFYLQTNRLAIKKENSYKFLVLHAMIYQLLFLLLPVLMGEFRIYLRVSIFMGLSHFIIDTFKFFVSKFYKSNEKASSKIFLIDQILHILSIWFISNYLKYFPVVIVEYIIINNFDVIRWITLILLILKPSNIYFKKIYSSFKPVLALQEDIETNNAGQAIGNLERILFVLCLYFNVYTAAGLILTAKSIARYDKISKEPEFAEYYLLGTLSSILFAILSFIICFGL